MQLTTEWKIVKVSYSLGRKNCEVKFQRVLEPSWLERKFGVKAWTETRYNHTFNYGRSWIGALFPDKEEKLLDTMASEAYSWWPQPQPHRNHKDQP